MLMNQLSILKIHFKVNFFHYILDITINSINGRFELLKQHSDYFLFLYDISKLTYMHDEHLKKKKNDLQLLLTNEGSVDINSL